MGVLQAKSCTTDGLCEETEDKIAELQHTLAGSPSDLCSVCGSGSVQDMLLLARKVDSLRAEASLERALAVQAAAAVSTANAKALEERDTLISSLRCELQSSNLNCSRLEDLLIASEVALDQMRIEHAEQLRKSIVLREKFEKMQKEAGVWNVARGKVEEELFFLSDLREKEGAERVAATSRCSALLAERSELLQHIANMEQQLANAAAMSTMHTCSSSGGACAEHELRQQPGREEGGEDDYAPAQVVAVLRDEVAQLKAQRSIDDAKFALLQAEFQNMITSTTSKISESKMFQYHYQ